MLCACVGTCECEYPVHIRVTTDDGKGNGRGTNRWTACRVLASHLTIPAVPPPLGRLSSILPAARTRLFQPANPARPTGLLPDRSHTFTAPPCRFPRVLPNRDRSLNRWRATLVAHDLSRVYRNRYRIHCGSRHLIRRCCGLCDDIYSNSKCILSFLIVPCIFIEIYCYMYNVHCVIFGLSNWKIKRYYAIACNGN